MATILEAYIDNELALKRFLRRFIKSREGIDDLAQEAFLDAWRQLATLREPEKLRPWLCGILRYKVCRLRRSDGQEPVRQAEELELAEAVPSDDRSYSFSGPTCLTRPTPISTRSVPSSSAPDNTKFRTAFLCAWCCSAFRLLTSMALYLAYKRSFAPRRVQNSVTRGRSAL